MTQTKANFLLLIAGITWGIGFIAQETAMDDIGPILFVGIRFTIAALALLPFAIYEIKKGSYQKSELNLKSYIIIGTIFFVGMLFQQIGLLFTTVTNAGFLTGLYLILVPIAMQLFFKQPQHKIIFPAAVLALAGVFFINGGHLDKINSGDLLIIICSFFWGAHVIYVGWVAQKVEAPYLIAFIQFAIAGALGLISFFIFQPIVDFEPMVTPTLLINATPELLYSALVAGAFAFTLQIVGQRYTTEASAAILLSSEALFAALFATLLLNEVLSFTGYIGCAMVFAAMMLVQLVPMLKLSK